jgi:hypothetical protein
MTAANDCGEPRNAEVFDGLQPGERPASVFLARLWHRRDTPVRLGLRRPAGC